MCGIAAVVSPDRPIPPDCVARMAQAMRHRGPDGQGVVALPGCHLGHTRLSIIDPAGGQQPMSDETGRFTLVFNGEIYNYRELRRLLADKGFAFRTASDTEVLLRAYQAFGPEVVQRLNGQFAFACWDRETRELFAARDRLGEKPLYFARSAGGHVVLASEIKGLLASGLIEPVIDPVAVDAYLGLLYVPPDRSIYRNVQVLPPAHAWRLRNGEWTSSRYWRPAFGASPARESAADVAAHLRALIAQAVRRQLVADVPLGAFLSGGLDSSTIVACMAQASDRPVRTFAVGFGDLIDELPYARAVADRYRTDHHDIAMDLAVGPLLERMTGIYDEPFADSSNLPTTLVAEFARRHVKVVLSGDGGDELFGGYAWYRPLLGSLRRTPRGALPLLAGQALCLRAACRAGLPFGERRDRAAARYVGARAARRFADLWQRHVSIATNWLSDRAAWWGARGVPQGAHAACLATVPPPHVELMDRAVDFDLNVYLPGDILVKVDRAAMASSLETRAPFLDVELVEYVLSLPWTLRFATGADKSLLRAACADLWPETVRRRGKQGFGGPLAHWIRREDVRRLADRVFAPQGPLFELLPGLRRIPRQTLSAQDQWTLLCLGLWLEPRTGCLPGRA